MDVADTEGYDWPNWRGPDRDGIAKEASFNLRRIKTVMKPLWTKELGKGFTSPSIVGDYLFTMGNSGREDTVYCLHAGTGRTVWSYSYPCALGQYPGPRTSPSVDGDRVYTLSREGDAFCFDARSGKIVWEKDLRDEAGAVPPPWGFAGSPVVGDDTVLYNVLTSGLALDKMTGEVAWQSAQGPSGYATPITFTHEGRRRAAFFGSNRLYVVDADTGEIAYSHRWVTSFDVNAADPLVLDDGSVFISSGYGNGCALLELADGRIEVAYENRRIASHFSAFILHNGYIYGNAGDANSHRGFFFCLDASSGEILWEHAAGMGSVTAVNDTLILLTDRGDLAFSRMTPGGYEEVASTSLPSGIYWSPPTFNKGRLFINSNFTGILSCYDVGF